MRHSRPFVTHRLRRSRLQLWGIFYGTGYMETLHMRGCFYIKVCAVWAVWGLMVSKGLTGCDWLRVVTKLNYMSEFPLKYIRPAGHRGKCIEFGCGKPVFKTPLNLLEADFRKVTIALPNSLYICSVFIYFIYTPLSSPVGTYHHFILKQPCVLS